MQIRVALVVTATAALAIGAGPPAGLAHSGARGPQAEAPISSPDGRRSATLKRGNAGRGWIFSGLVGGPKKLVYTSNDSCCDGLVWANPTLLVFADDYRVFTLDVTTGRLVRIAGFSNFAVSPDGRWVAGWGDQPPGGARYIGVVPIAGGSCRLVPSPDDADDWAPRFSADGRRLRFLRQPWEEPLPGRGHPTGPARTHVVAMASLVPAPRLGC